MSKVYLIEDNGMVTYFGTKRAAERFQSGMEEPERIIPADAAEECERLDAAYREMENRCIEVSCALKDLIAVCPMDVLKETPEGRNAVKLARKIDPGFMESCGL